MVVTMIPVALWVSIGVLVFCLFMNCGSVSILLVLRAAVF